MKSERVVSLDGTVRYYNEQGQLHNENGPAIESPGVTLQWYNNGNRHRLNGPAIEHASGLKYWYYNNKHIKCYSQEEFERLIKLKVFW